MIPKCSVGLLLLGLVPVACTSPPAEPKPSPRVIEGMWSDPPGAIGMLCFFTCTDTAIERLNALLDDPANDARPFPELRAEAEKHSRETYLRPRLTEAALKNYPLDPADDPGLLRCEPWGLARQMFAPHQIEIRRLGEDRVELRYGEWNARRTVYMDGRARQEGVPPSLLGHSVGRWERDTLVVETTGVSANLTPWRFEHSDGLQTVERFTRSDDGETLSLTATLTDPGILRQPVVIRKIWKWAPDSKITSYEDCERPAAVTKGVSPP
jgi:hypothetical protein